MIAHLIAGVIGIGMLATFLGIMLWWVKAPPLIIIVVIVMALLIYDFVQTLRFGESGARALTRGDGDCRRPARPQTQSINVSRPRRSPGFSATRRIASSVPAT